MPIGPPSHRPDPKSACMWASAPMLLTIAAEPASTGSRSTRAFHWLVRGNTGQLLAPGSGWAGEPPAAYRPASTTATVATTAERPARIAGEG